MARAAECYHVYDKIPWQGIDHPVIEVVDEACYPDALRAALDMITSGKADEVSVGRFLLGGYFSGVELNKEGDKLRIFLSVPAPYGYPGEAIRSEYQVGNVTVEPVFNDATNEWMVFASEEVETPLPRDERTKRLLVDKILGEMDRLESIAEDSVDKVIRVAEELLPP